MTEQTTWPDASDPDGDGPEDGLGFATNVPAGGRRARLRAIPVVGHAYRFLVFGLGLLCIAVGVAAAVLPGPLTIPPVLLGLYIWSTEFAWADRFFQAFLVKAKAAWEHAKAHPVPVGIITVLGLAMAVAAAWAIKHYAVHERVLDVIGL